MATPPLRLRVVATTVVCLAAIGSASGSPMFRGLGFLPGAPHSAATAISADGTTVVGNSGSRAFRWRSAGGMQDLGTLPRHSNSIANAVSADGSTVIGTSQPPSGVAGKRAFRWTSAGMQDLGTLPGYLTSQVRGVSADGSTIVGWSSRNSWPYEQAFRWTPASGLEQLPFATANAMSADGATVAGVGADICPVAVLHDSNGTHFITFGIPEAMSADGLVVAGWSPPCECSKCDDIAWRWSQAGGYQELQGRAHSMSADGTVMVGAAASGAVIWNEQLGMVSLNAYLPTLGLDLMGWTLTSATGVSSDGTTIVGTARNPSGQIEAWVAVIPEPSALAVVLLCAGGLVLIRAPARRRVVG